MIPFDPKQLGAIAAAEVRKVQWWFRKRYRLPPTDPRFLNLTEEELLLEYEIWLADRGKTLKTCHTCGYQTHRDFCPDCDKARSGDAVEDDILERIEAGEEVDLDKALRGDGWEPVEGGA